jgi:hypothetical protein
LKSKFNFSPFCNFPPAPPSGGISYFTSPHPSPDTTPTISDVEIPTPTPKKLRDEYPFLSSPTCPPELKILAADKITAYHTYCAAHRRLVDCCNPSEQLATVTELVEAFITNRLIYEEFAYYAQHGTVLGRHRIFEEYKQIRQLRSLPVIELFKLQQKLEYNIWRIQRLLKSKKQPHLRPDREQSLHAKSAQLAEVLRLLA